ncbi:MAG TPA: type II secretion system protein [Dehalococcoidales bacterium]|nr:type II secretion system protein [Dehalococcoidales bacterium]
MIKPIFQKFIGSREGFTLVELLIAIVISGILGAGTLTALYQISNVNHINNAKTTAVKQVENSLHYLIRDMHMAQKVEANGQGFWLKLDWINWEDNAGIQVIYYVQGGQLTRSYSVNGSQPVIAVVGRHITTASAQAPDPLAYPATKAWNITLSASASSRFKQATETRQLNIVPRPGS